MDLTHLKKRIPKGWYGLEHPEGWDQIVFDLDVAINEIDPNYKLYQCKEKFGGLRYYVEISEDVSTEQWDKVYKLINEAEHKSLLTCQVCGSGGKRRCVGYVTTLCDKHFEWKG